jgi:transposase
VVGLDFADDRLAGLLDRLAGDEVWSLFERRLNQGLLRVYGLGQAPIRVDSTTASGYWQVSEDGLFQFGHSQDRRGDQLQVKIMLSTLDPLGMPLVTQVVGGQHADDPLYLPAIEQVRQSLGSGGLLFIGDSKLPSKETRAVVQQGGDFYLGPLSLTQLPQAQLLAYLEPVWSGEQALQAVMRAGADEQAQEIAVGFERQVKMSVPLGEESLQWSERRLIIRSLSQAKTSGEALQSKLERAEQALRELTHYRKGKKRFDQVAPLQKKVATILKRYQVEGLLQVDFEEHQPQGFARYRVERQFHLRVTRNETAIQAAQRQFGWRVYVTNTPPEQLSLEQAVLAYRQEYLVERGFGRLKGKPLTLSPMYLQQDQRATGLVRLLTIALRVLTLLEFPIRRKLANGQEKLAGLYPGNPKRATARPTAEALLHAFQPITLTIVTLGGQVHRHIDPLSEVQQKVLTLLDIPMSIYSSLAVGLANPP